MIRRTVAGVLGGVFVLLVAAPGLPALQTGSAPSWLCPAGWVVFLAVAIGWVSTLQHSNDDDDDDDDSEA